MRLGMGLSRWGKLSTSAAHVGDWPLHRWVKPRAKGNVFRHLFPLDVAEWGVWG